LIHTPIIGEITFEAKLVVPVRKAKTVPSILTGVILAKSARVGSVLIAYEITPKMVSVTIMKAMSLMPTSWFQRQAKAYEAAEEMTETTVAHYKRVRTSISLRYY